MFAERIRQLVQRAYPAPDYTAKARDEQALKLFLKSLPTKHNMRTTMSMQSFKSLSEAVEYGTKFEHVISMSEDNDKRKNFSHVRKVDEPDEVTQLSQVIKEQFKEMGEFRAQMKEEMLRFTQTQTKSEKSAPKKPPVKSEQTKKEKKTPQNSPCHGCGQLGHWKPDCPDNTRNKSKGSKPSGENLNS